MGELFRRGGILGVHAADAVEERGRTLEDAQKVAVVPLVVNDLDDDGAGHAVAAHQSDELFRRRVFRRRVRAGRKGKTRVALEDMNVRVNNQRWVVSHPFGKGRRKDGATRSAVLGFGREQWKCQRASGGLGEKAAASEHGQIQCFFEVPSCPS